LLWLSPIGWVTQVRAYAGDRWPVLVLPVAAAVAVAAAAAVVLAARRDLGAGLVPARPGRARAARSLRSPLALAWRLQWGNLIGWAVGGLIYGAAFGSIANNIGSMLGSAQVRNAIARLGGQSGMTDAYLAAMMSILGLIVAGYAISAVLRLWSDETSQRAEPLLATATPRVSWGASYLTVAAAGSAAVLTAAGLGAGLAFGLRAGDAGTQVPRLLGAALAQWPAVLTVAARRCAAVRAAAGILRVRRVDSAGRGGRARAAGADAAAPSVDPGHLTVHPRAQAAGRHVQCRAAGLARRRGGGRRGDGRPAPPRHRLTRLTGWDNRIRGTSMRLRRG
jgi:ABC-2 type transport system permease protein